MLGAIAGDIIGSVYESRPIKKTVFPLFHPLCRFTDDTVLTVALAESLLHGAPFVGLLKQSDQELRGRGIWLRPRHDSG
jgi:ADP-ribosylglycohydrolase